MPLLHYVELGDSTQQSIVVIHGLFGSHKNWSRISKQLALNFHIIAIDCRNHGDSFNSTNMNYHVMANDVYLLIQELKLDNPIILGHSMGGKVAMQLSSEYSDVIAKIIVVDIAPVAYSHTYHSLITPILNIDINDVSSRKAVDDALKEDIPEDFLRLFLLQSLAQDSGRWYWKIDWQNLLDNMTEITKAPELIVNNNIDSLFVFGENSDYYSESGLKTVNHFFPKAEIHTIAEGNHWLHYEHASEFLSILDKYLNA